MDYFEILLVTDNVDVIKSILHGNIIVIKNTCGDSSHSSLYSIHFQLWIISNNRNGHNIKVTSVVKHNILGHVLSSKKTLLNSHSLIQCIFQSYAYVMLTRRNSKQLMKCISVQHILKQHIQYAVWKQIMMKYDLLQLSM